MNTKTAITPTPIPSPSPILAPKDSPPDRGVEVGFMEEVEEEEGAVVEMEVGLGFCIVSLPFTTKSPFPPLQHVNALGPSP
jgi:hypothetical protein